MDRLRLSRIRFSARLPDDVRCVLLSPGEHAEAWRLLAGDGAPGEAPAADYAVIGVVVASELAGALVGAPLLDRNALVLRAMAVRAADRRHGLGTALVAALLDVARAIDVDVVGSACPVDDHAAQTWLERCGFRLFSVSPQPRPSPQGLRIGFVARYARLVSRPDSVRWPRPEDLTPRVSTLLTRLWGDPPSIGA